MRPGADLLLWQDLHKLPAASDKEILWALHTSGQTLGFAAEDGTYDFGDTFRKLWK